MVRFTSGPTTLSLCPGIFDPHRVGVSSLVSSLRSTSCKRTSLLVSSLRSESIDSRCDAHCPLRSLAPMHGWLAHCARRALPCASCHESRARLRIALCRCSLPLGRSVQLVLFTHAVRPLFYLPTILSVAMPAAASLASHCVRTHRYEAAPLLWRTGWGVPCIWKPCALIIARSSLRMEQCTLC